MRHVSEAIATALGQGAARLCHVWLVERLDGVTLGFSDHDRPLVFLGVTCRPQSGLTEGAGEDALGSGEASSAAVAGVLSSDAIAAGDIAAGLYDEASIGFYVVDWSDPAHYVTMGTGRFGRLEARGGVAEGAAFIAHVEGPAARLQRVIGRRFGFLCDAALGDARCGLDPAHLAAPTCDKRYRTCVATFDNGLNFRGFPDLPGEDFLTIYPRLGDVMDGGGRGQGAGR